jgi:glycosyltransferase involved in cell wall biosynthesis
MLKTLLIIPCYNEEACIGTILQELSRVIDKSVITLVINDGSNDSTSEQAQKPGIASVIDLPVNLGVGGAVQTGLIYAREHDVGVAIKFDGDGQHDPAYIHELMRPILDNSADIVVGSRFMDENSGFKSTFTRRIGIGFLQFISKALTGQTFTDPTSGFRAYNRRAIEFMSCHYPSFDYPEPEEIVLARKNGLRIVEVPVQMRERQAGISTISSSISVYYMLKVVLAMIFIFLRQPVVKREHRDV